MLGGKLLGFSDYELSTAMKQTGEDLDDLAQCSHMDLSVEAAERACCTQWDHCAGGNGGRANPAPIQVTPARDDSADIPD